MHLAQYIWKFITIIVRRYSLESLEPNYSKYLHLSHFKVLSWWGAFKHSMMSKCFFRDGESNGKNSLCYRKSMWTNIYIYTYAYEKMFTETSYPYCFFLDGYESIISIIILITFGK